MKLTARDIVNNYMEGKIEVDSEWVRVEPKKYHLKLDLPIELGNGGYLNYYLKLSTFDIHNNIQIDGVITEFTDKDIEDLKIPIEHFIKEEVM